MQDAADEWHCKEEVSGLQTEIDSIQEEDPSGNDLQEVLKTYQDKLKDALEDYVEGAKLRRAKLDYVAKHSPHYDYHQRCKFKHRATAFVQATETYLADPNQETYDLMWRSEQRFWKTVSQLMGYQPTNCGRCLSDQINRGAFPGKMEEGK